MAPHEKDGCSAGVVVVVVVVGGVAAVAAAAAAAAAAAPTTAAAAAAFAGGAALAALGTAGAGSVLGGSPVVFAAQCSEKGQQRSTSATS